MGKLRVIDESSHDKCELRPQLTAAESCSDGVALSNYAGKAAVVTLGCAKNHVDSEVMLGVLEKNGFEIVADVAAADVAIVNTCGFLQSAVKESIDCILEVAELKKTGRLRKLVVAGCAVERYTDPEGKGGSIRDALPEVDRFISVNEILDVANVSRLSDDTALVSPFSEVLHDAARPYFLYDDTMPRRLATRRHTAYVKVSEGCDRPCTFCIIPRIRGPMRSRTVESVVKEIIGLGAQGVREVNFVAQDLTAFGADAARSDSTKATLERLLRQLDRELQGSSVEWIRLLYAYPIGIDEALLSAVVELPRVCKYLDFPLQHVSEGVLKLMKRPLGRYSPRRMVEFIRTFAPSVALRTTFIVGFPGETEEDVDQLESFIREGHFTNVGIFTYSLEEGTPAFDLPGRVSEREKRERRERLMLAQQEVAAERNASFVGRTIKALIEGPHEDTDLLVSARAEFQAPEVDSVVLINDVRGRDGESKEAELRPGTFVNVAIDEVAGYDLVGSAVVDDC